MKKQIAAIIKTKVIICILVVSFFPSCSGPKNVAYFQTLGDTAFVNRMNISFEPIIQKNDLLSINITSLSPEATAIFMTPNVPVTSSSSAVVIANNSATTGYLVDQNGYIQFPVLGNLAVAGLTKKSLADTITARIVREKFLLEPIVSIRILSFRVTVLGEVSRPSVISVPNEKITILEALAQAGDLTIFAKRENLLLVREENNQKVTKRINLNTSEIFNSPYYYLKANDIIYAEPNNSKVAATSSTRQLLPIIISGLSFLVIILDRIFRS